MTPTTYLRQTTAALAALLLVLSVLGPIGTVAAQPSVSVTQTADSTTVNPGDNVTLTAQFDVSELNAPQLSATTPDGWTIESQTATGGAAYSDGTWTWLAGDTDGVNVSYTVEYTVSVPDDAAPGQYTISADGSALSPADSSKTSDTASTTITVEAPDTNSPPTADAGTDQTVDEGASVSLDASGSSDPDGDDLSYSWTQTAGSSVTVTDASTATPTFTAPEVDADETLTFEVTVSDGEDSDTDTVAVTVQDVPDEPANQPPTADAGPNQTVDESATVVLTGEASTDEDGSIASYAWTQTGGPDVTLADAATATPEFTAPDVDGDTQLTFELTVTDDDGETASDTVTVTVQDTDPIDPPEADPETSVSLSPTDGQSSVGGTTTYELVIDDAEGGVGAYSATVSLDDASVGTITNVDLAGSPAGQTTDIDIAADGSSVSIDAALMNTSDTGSVTVATITVQGEAPGSTGLSTTVDALGNEQGVSYTVTGTSGATLSVVEKSTSLSLSPANDEVSIDDTTTYDLVVDTAEGGVGAYSATVSLDDASVATITDVELLGNPAEQTTEVDIAADGSSVSIDAALMDTDDSGSVVVATITVQGEAAGATDLSIDATALGDEGGTNYAITGTTGATLTVTEVTVGNFANPVTDTDSDGEYEDINGDGTLNIVDVQALFANLDDAAVQNNVEKFDFNDDGSVNIVDVQALFFELLSADQPAPN